MRRFLILAFVALAVVGLCLVYTYNPESSWWMPKCPFRLITGFDCPSCGNTRALHSLMHGRFAAAMSYNAMAVVLVPLAGVIIWLCVISKRRLSDPLLRYLVYGYLAIYMIWWVVRNII